MSTAPQTWHGFQLNATSHVKSVLVPPNHLEEAELRYEKITRAYKDGNIIHSDSWNERSTA